jgi:hypothetical protein
VQWITETEPEYDVNERDNWYALGEYDAALCPQCNQLRAVCEDSKLALHPRLHTCYLTASQLTYSRRWHKQFEDVKPDRDGWLPTDGSFVYVAEGEPEPDERVTFGDELKLPGSVEQ